MPTLTGFVIPSSLGLWNAIRQTSMVDLNGDGLTDIILSGNICENTYGDGTGACKVSASFKHSGKGEKR